MNITPHATNLPLATVVNQPTEGLRRENHQREIITQVTATNPSVAEKGVASDKERARTPAQVNEQVDFANLRKQAEQDASSITEHENQQDGQKNSEQHEQQNSNAKGDNSDQSEENKNKKQASIDEKIINQLQQRDKEVRTHELAHATAGGAATGSPSYTFEVGPDGKKYAVSGEVAVDLSSIAGDPQATIVKMQKVHTAALAPANPSTQDTRVAASAAQKILAAQSELFALKSSPENQENKANSDLNAGSTSLNDKQNNEGADFDVLINQTLSAQETIISNPKNQDLPPPQKVNNVQSNDVQQRALRIESHYFKISQGYEKPDNFQFELTA